MVFWKGYLLKNGCNFVRWRWECGKGHYGPEGSSEDGKYLQFGVDLIGREVVEI